MKTCLIALYFGKWPIWFPAFLQSCKYNTSIDWMFFTDCEIPEKFSENVKFIPFTQNKFDELASSKLGFEVQLQTPYKACDFKPVYGFIFDDYIREYDFWGHCDIDIVWGDIRHFIKSNVLEKYDVISASQDRCCGHFQLFRNQHEASNLFSKMKNYEAILKYPAYCKFDEPGMTEVIRSQADKGSIKVYWPKTLTNFSNPPSNYDSSLGWLTNQWYWENGKLYHGSDEVMYLHFLTWKRSLKLCKFYHTDDPASFYISYSHVGLNKLDMPSMYSRFDSLVACEKEIWRYRIAKLRKKISGTPQLWFQLQSM